MPAHPADPTTAELERFRWRDPHNAEDVAVTAAARAITARTAPTSPRDAHRILSVVAAFLAWGIEQDLPLDPETVLTPDRVEDYLATGERRTWVHGTQIGVRWALRRAGIANTRRAPWRQRRLTPGSKTVSYPYTDQEIALYRDAAPKQRTPARSRYMQAAMAFHHGAGLHAVELLRLRGSDVELRDGVYLVHLTERHTATSHSPARTTPVRAAYTATVRRLLEVAGEGSIAHESDAPTMSALTSMRQWLEYPSRLPELSPRRLRMSWLRDVLNTAVPLKAVLLAAGLQTLPLNAVGPSLVDVRPDAHRHLLASGTATLTEHRAA